MVRVKVRVKVRVTYPQGRHRRTVVPASTCRLSGLQDRVGPGIGGIPCHHAGCLTYRIRLGLQWEATARSSNI